MRIRMLILRGIFLLSIFLISCSDDPVTSQAEHYEAEGILFFQSGIKIAEIFQGVTNDTLYAPVDSMTSGIDVKFYNSEKSVLEPPTESGITFDWQLSDTSIAGVWQHPGEEGGFEFHLEGKSSGTTLIEFFIVHEGHTDFRSGKIPVVVQ